MKAKIRKTGEIVDVIAFKYSEACPEKDWVRYVDSEGLDLIQELNALEDLEVIDKTELVAYVDNNTLSIDIEVRIIVNTLYLIK